MPKLVKKPCIQCKDCDSFVTYKYKEVKKEREYSFPYKKIFTRTFIICPSCGKRIILSEALVPVNLFSDEKVITLYDGLKAKKV